MGLIAGLMQFLFGDGRNVVAETAEVFREMPKQAQSGPQMRAPTVCASLPPSLRCRGGDFSTGLSTD